MGADDGRDALERLAAARDHVGAYFEAGEAHGRARRAACAADDDEDERRRLAYLARDLPRRARHVRTSVIRTSVVRTSVIRTSVIRTSVVRSSVIPTLHHVLHHGGETGRGEQQEGERGALPARRCAPHVVGEGRGVSD